MKRFLVCLISGLALATGCGSLSDTAAVTADDSTLSVDELNDLAGSEFVAAVLEAQNAPLVFVGEGGVGGESARFVAGLFIDTAVWEQVIEDAGGEVTDEDRANAEATMEQQLQSLPEPGDAMEAFLLDYFTVTGAAQRVLAAQAPAPTAADIEAYFAENADEFRDHVCFEGVQVLDEPRIAEVSAALTAGRSVEEVVSELNAGGEQVAAPVSETECVPAAQLPTADTPVGAILFDSPLNSVNPVVISEAEGGPFFGVLRVTRRGDLTIEDEQVQETIISALQEEAQVQAQEASTAARSEAVDRVEITVDPRYGTFDASVPQLIAPPSQPRPEQPTTTVPFDPATQG